MLEMKTNKNALYIVLSQTHTRFGRVVRKVTGSTYNHASIAFSEDLSDLCAFARRRFDDPLSASLIKESTERYIAGGYEDAQIGVFRLQINADQKAKIDAFIESLKMEKAVLYNLYSALTYPLLRGFNTCKAYTCSEFAAKILVVAGFELPSEPCKILPQHLATLLADYKVYQGGIIAYVGNHNYCNDVYDDRTPVRKRLCNTIAGCTRLGYRNMHTLLRFTKCKLTSVL